jgi:hypothetical protein
MPSKTGKKGPRMKTGCLPCRARHLRCIGQGGGACARCRLAGIRCEKSPMIVYEPCAAKLEPSIRPKESLPSPECTVEPAIEEENTAEVPLLLRHFQDGIATWMDLFDPNMSYQRLLMRKAMDSELLRCCICALASKQLALVKKTKRWQEAAETWYGKSLHCLLHALASQYAGHAAPGLDQTIPACIRLLSYKLMASPGVDYTRHFCGAKSLIESHFDEIRQASRNGSSPLIVASYWIFFRQDIGIAMSNYSGPSL